MQDIIEGHIDGVVEEEENTISAADSRFERRRLDLGCEGRS